MYDLSINLSHVNLWALNMWERYTDSWITWKIANWKCFVALFKFWHYILITLSLKQKQIHFIAVSNKIWFYIILKNISLIPVLLH